MRFPGEELVEKMWETIADKGIGGLFKPWQMRREGQAYIELKCEEIIATAEAMRKAEIIVKDRDLTSCMTLKQLANDELISDTIRREKNVTIALLNAQDVLLNETQSPPEEKVDDDWLFRWRDNASQVSSHDLQNLWGRVLAGEVKAPGSYSLRTLEFLKNLSQQEAEAIAKLSQFVIGEAIIYRGSNKTLENYGINFSILLDMQQLGIITGVQSLGIKYELLSAEPSRFVLALISNSLVLVVTADDPKKKVSIPGYPLTALGKQILSLGTFGTNAEYLKDVSEHLKTQGVSVIIANYARINSEKIEVLDAIDL